ncbi:type I-E CRISPR-associated endoribonuclease Cas2 [Nocardiopsis sp. CNT-189]|uniref:type I-E CRISPR-associated endoribonuclease Cas2e n=1 Tax=Nocardiopsis oceanisediminis TaxID=2816862 RepID=UPI003B398429
MTSMVVISTSAVPPHVRGALSRWMIEPQAGLYIGTMTARVRDRLWELVCESVGEGAAVCAYPADNEQGFLIATAGEDRRHVVDFDGVQLIRFMGVDTGSEGEQPQPPLPEGW